jgi:hypothetical protein
MDVKPDTSANNIVTSRRSARDDETLCGEDSALIEPPRACAPRKTRARRVGDKTH